MSRPPIVSRFLAGIAALASLAAVGTSCSSQGAGAGGGCDAPSKVTIASFPVGATLPTDLAQGIGAFSDVEKKCNTKIVVQSFDAPQPMVAGVLGGQVQFAVSNVQNQILAAAQGQNLTGLLSMAQGGNGVIIGKADVGGSAKGVNAVKDYPEQSIWAMTTLVGLSRLVVSALNQEVGNDPTKTKYVQVGSTGIASHVASGSADLGYVPSPTAAVQAVEGGKTRALLNTSGPSMYELLGFIPGWTLLASPDFVKKYPQLSAEMTAAELKALYFIHDHLDDPEAVYAKMPASYRSATTLDTWKKAWGWNASAYVVTGWITRADIVRTAKLMQRYDVLTKDYDVSKLPDTVLDKDVLTDAFESAGIEVPSKPVDVDLLKKTSD